MSATGYAEFLATKTRRVGEIGPEVSHDECHPSLFAFQRHIVTWAVRKGRAAIFADTGLGKTVQELEWCRLLGGTALILTPLSVARQTVAEAARIGIVAKYVRSGAEVTGHGIWVTNYEMADRFDADNFDAVVLDESAILRNFSGPTRIALTKQWANTKYRLVATATPMPNDVEELCNQAEFLGVIPRQEMLAAYFVHDEDGWRLKGHAHSAMWRWMATWAVAVRKPSDLGYPSEDSLYDLPPLRLEGTYVQTRFAPEGQLFATELGGIQGRHQFRTATLADRVEAAATIANQPGQWLVWCGLNAEADALAAAIHGAVNVPGSWSPDAKTDAIERFIAGETRVMVSKVSIAGVGMNFQHCHQMVFCGLSDSYDAYYQAIRRCWRFGQTSPVDVHIVTSTAEGQIVDNVRRKEADAIASIDRLIKATKEMS